MPMLLGRGLRIESVSLYFHDHPMARLRKNEIWPSRSQRDGRIASDSLDSGGQCAVTSALLAFPRLPWLRRRPFRRALILWLRDGKADMAVQAGCRQQPLSAPWLRFSLAFVRTSRTRALVVALLSLKLS